MLEVMAVPLVSWERKSKVGRDRSTTLNSSRFNFGTTLEHHAHEN